ncbi:hypothetical protein LSH36_816g00039 [Paralvinella palmiformis]|uniref:Uncharacterized protein n=1 Tax=Paralvinella palmiformis TaxID=53620 RepID=A0AAD9MS47_9ANNE|nr:hypothetical protein LSH36_816g00039 [Paralvinella palmiformis]
MTTAARPTFEPARGGSGKGENDLSALSKQYSSRDLPSHTRLKYRQDGQGTSDELRSRDFRKELEEREHGVREKRDRERGRGNVLLNRCNVQLETRTRCPELIRFSQQWDDDVVFKNCAKGEEDKRLRGFINDALRSEFHKKFMDKYIK